MLYMWGLSKRKGNEKEPKKGKERRGRGKKKNETIEGEDHPSNPSRLFNDNTVSYTESFSSTRR